jgi:succinate dehydrogenase / fumarate reductase cytochrome b subunit
MTATPVDRAAHFYRASIGKKVLMAVTGLILFGFLIGHVAGNMQLFAGAEKINAYSEFLHHSPGLLWGTRLVLLLSVGVHIIAAVQLYARKARARPVAYTRKGNRGGNLPSRVMLWSGFGILAFVIYHLLHFTTGTVHPDFIEGDVFHNMVSAFQRPVVAGVYVAAMGVLCLHLFHGLYSMTQSVGLENPRMSARAKHIAVAIAVVLALAFAAIPIAVLANLIS